MIGCGLSVGLQLVLGTWDAVWRDGWTGWVVAVVLAVGVVVTARGLVAFTAASSSEATGRPRRLWVLGLFLALAAMIVANPAFVASQSGVALGWAGLVVVVANALGAWTLLRPDPWPGGVRVGAAVLLVAGVGVRAVAHRDRGAGGRGGAPADARHRAVRGAQRPPAGPARDPAHGRRDARRRARHHRPAAALHARLRRPAARRQRLGDRPRRARPGAVRPAPAHPGGGPGAHQPRPAARPDQLRAAADPARGRPRGDRAGAVDHEHDRFRRPRAGGRRAPDAGRLEPALRRLAADRGGPGGHRGDHRGAGPRRRHAAGGPARLGVRRRLRHGHLAGAPAGHDHPLRARGGPPVRERGPGALGADRRRRPSPPVRRRPAEPLGPVDHPDHGRRHAAARDVDPHAAPRVEHPDPAGAARGAGRGGARRRRPRSSPATSTRSRAGRRSSCWRPRAGSRPTTEMLTSPADRPRVQDRLGVRAGRDVRSRPAPRSPPCPTTGPWSPSSPSTTDPADATLRARGTLDS